MSKSDHVLRFKVSLREIKPPIWRRIEILSDATFWDLHVAIQDAMGWQDCHLHAFEDPRRRGPDRVFIGIPMDEYDDFGEPPTVAGWRIEVPALLGLTARKFRYEYDFGDGWVHDVVLEQIRPRERDERIDSFPRCLAGRRRCPPEDIGGPWCYQDLLEELAARKAGTIVPRDGDDDDADDLDEADDEALSRLEGVDVEAFDPGAVVFDDPHERLERMMDPY